MSQKDKISSKEKAILIARAALEKKADNVVIMSMSDVAAVCDFFLICGGSSERMNKAIADHIVRALKELSIKPSHIEGYNEGSWILLDYIDVVIHIFKNDLREFYSLERLWADAPQNSITEDRVKNLRERTQDIIK
jgi:ribosome-associated protein